jgi:hypothetical protein
MQKPRFVFLLRKLRRSMFLLDVFFVVLLTCYILLERSRALLRVKVQSNTLVEVYTYRRIGNVPHFGRDTY